MNTTIIEANRYIENAKALLEEKAIRVNGIYKDSKYIKLAGHAAYTGVLVALDSLISSESKRRKSVDHYRAFLTKYDKKLLTEFNNLYIILHLDMGYDGISDSAIIKRGMTMAKEFIGKIKSRIS